MSSLADSYYQLIREMNSFNMHPITNRLKRIQDAVASGRYTTDIDKQTDANNYTYDQSGNLTSDAQAGINNIKWSADGKVLEVRKGGGQEPDTLIKFVYDATGSRVIKEYEIDPPTQAPSSSFTFYLRDANSEPIAIYESHDFASWQEYAVLNEWNIYGSEAQGRFARKLGYDVNSPDTITYSFEGFWYPADSAFERRLMYKEYEHKDHLGNVRLVYSDLKTAPLDINYTPLSFDLDLRAVDNYYPFGMLQPERRWQSGGYRYGFNGKEMDNEIRDNANHDGTATSYDFGARMYDPRVGRWLTADPKSGKYPGWSPYHFGYCSPIITIDPDGEENVVVIGGVDNSVKDKGDRYKFINSAIKKVKDFRVLQGTENTTVLIYDNGLTTDEIEEINTQLTYKAHPVQTGKIDLIYFNNLGDINHYLNSKSLESDNISEDRLKDKITDVVIYGHGLANPVNKGPSFELDYPDLKVRWGIDEVKGLNPVAFDNPTWLIETCNSATPMSKSGNNLTKATSEQTKGTSYGWFGRSDYGTIYNWPKRVTFDTGEKVEGIGKAHSQPSAGEKNDGSSKSERIKYVNGEKKD